MGEAHERWDYEGNQMFSVRLTENRSWKVLTPKLMGPLKQVELKLEASTTLGTGLGFRVTVAPLVKVSYIFSL